MRKIAMMTVAFGALLVGTATQAQAQAYGTAGCGLGSMAFGAKPGFVQVFAATTNGTFGAQTFGISSGTSNCGSTSGAAGARAFIETNRPALAKDISRGSGETIQNLATLGGCANSAAVGAKLQKNFKAIFPTASASDAHVSAAVVSMLKSDASLTCNKI